MLDKIKKISENKVLKIIFNIIYYLIFVIVIMMLIVVVLQRTSNNDISLGGYRMFTVATGSMVPKYNVSDILISKNVDISELKVGDDVVYKGKEGSFKDKFVTHQIISMEKQEDGSYNIITKGIANPEQDPEIKGEQIYGKIIYKVKSLSYIGKLISNIYVFYFFVFIPIAIIIFKQIRNIALSSEDDEGEEDKDDNGESK